MGGRGLTKHYSHPAFLDKAHLLCTCGKLHTFHSGQDAVEGRAHTLQVICMSCVCECVFVCVCVRERESASFSIGVGDMSLCMEVQYNSYPRSRHAEPDAQVTFRALCLLHNAPPQLQGRVRRFSDRILSKMQGHYTSE